MNQKILTYLKEYTTEPFSVDRLIVSAFCQFHCLDQIKNRLIQKYIISPKNQEESQALHFFSTLIQSHTNNFGFENLIQLFEFVISPSDKEVNGAVYTPQFIREFIVQEIFDRYPTEKIEHFRFGDLSVGCGAFLFDIAKKLKAISSASYQHIFQNNLYGLDIKAYSTHRAKLLLSLLAIKEGEDQQAFLFNLPVGNALNYDWIEKHQELKETDGFDIIIGNPPYVCSRNILDESKDLLKNWTITHSGHPDLYIPFFQIGMKFLREGGVLGYITMNTFLNSINGRNARAFFSQQGFPLKIINFGGEQLFKSRSTYTCLCFIEKKSRGSIRYTLSKSNEIKELEGTDFSHIKYSELNNRRGWVLNKPEVRENIHKIENTGKPLGELFTIRNGFATLANHVYLFKPYPKEDETHFFIKQNEHLIAIEKAVCKPVIKPNVLKNSEDITGHIEQIIFPYQLLDEESNLLFERKERKIVAKEFEDSVFQEKFPNAYRYLESKKERLFYRDKGKGKDYDPWFKFGRRQALTIGGAKLLFPYISDNPKFVFTDNESLMFYDGYAIIHSDPSELKVVQKILHSEIFWYYLKYTSKPYSGGYYGLGKQYIQYFGVCQLNDSEKKKFLAIKDPIEVKAYLLQKYQLPHQMLNES